MKKLLLIAVMLILLAVGTYAREGRLTLLAVHQEGDVEIGATADLHLVIKAGSGGVYLNTFPVTKIDTQISTRFAKDIACEYTKIDCSQYDFFYTITADSSIIGGPSAGAATTALTVFLLKGMKYNDKVMVTGTINSGGIIGPVGGLSAKLTAASQVAGAKKVLIPNSESHYKQNNKTIDLIAFGKNLSVEVTPVATIDDVVYEFTGKRLQEKTDRLSIDASYVATMRDLAVQLCNRSESLRKKTLGSLDELTKTRQESAKNLSLRARTALEQEYYYAAASYCFGADVKYQQIIQAANKKNYIATTISTEKQIANMRNALRTKQLKTITDLQAYMVVSERLKDAYDQLENSKTSNQSTDILAYAMERYYSAIAWAQFFDKPGQEYELNPEVLKESCVNKIAEAEESYQYVTLFFPNLLQATNQDIKEAYQYLHNKEYALCLHDASIAKANSDSVMSVIGAEDEQIDTIIDEKLSIGQQVIAEQSAQHSFPILGYSYWEYAKSLKQYDRYSTLLYSEYGLELSNLDIYFKRKSSLPVIEFNSTYIWVFATGLFAGLLVGLFWGGRNRTKKTLTENKKPNRKK